MGAQFDPTMITLQIVAMQCLYYAVLGLLLGMLRSLWGLDLSLDALFHARLINVGTAEGWIQIMSLLACAPVGSLLLCIVVERAKKCLDFTATLHLLHLLFCTYHSGFPLHWDYWAATGTSFVAMVLLGEFLCSRRELQDIPVLSI
uniref:Protein SYS1 homolog n=1 Tax=Phaeomonas parva TaxID=124430 RepID=A0A7S1U163_9STRA|mmetsp:Transcript_24319/g.76242  ORF Transcript_24319/g.76242 Transcript_24319/m.76242 type:complete len:146 (+) Transcript_24319:267-704(+)